VCPELRQRVLTPTQLVRLFWALGRLGVRDQHVYGVLEPVLRHVVDKFNDNELEALFGVLTELNMYNRWQLIFDIEKAMEARQDAGEQSKKARKQGYKKRWTRQTLTSSVVPYFSREGRGSRRRT